MSLNAPQPTLEKPETLVKRRGLFAAAWAAVAAAVLRQTTQPVQAANGDPVVLGVSNMATATTQVTTSGGFGQIGLRGISTSMGGAGLCGENSLGGRGGLGVVGRGSQYGLYGQVFNPNVAAEPTAGVFGLHDVTPAGSGVQGVAGTAAGDVGVFGQIPSSSSVSATGMCGLNYSTYTGSGPGTGGFAIYGVSAKGHSVVGAATTAGAGAVVGATNGVAGAYAGVFFGPVVVGGSFTVFGPKSAAVPHPDGTHRRLYCMESPESWFEDFGKGQLACGQADVTLDPDFAAVVNLDDYHVFLTGYGDRDLTVTEQTPTGFRVETKDAASTNRFSWRVVAKRRDIAAPRFETVEVPPEPVLPNIPEPPAAPESPHPRVGAHPRR
jgi:hypothetical protein